MLFSYVHKRAAEQVSSVILNHADGYKHELFSTFSLRRGSVEFVFARCGTIECPF